MSERSEFDISSSDSTVTDDNTEIIVKGSLFYRIFSAMWRHKKFILGIICVIALIFLAVYLGVNKSEVSSTPMAQTIKSLPNTFRNRRR